MKNKKHIENKRRVLRMEFLEERTLLSAMPLTSGEYTELTSKYSAIALPETMDDLNIITLDIAEGDGLTELRSAIETAGTTEKSDLIVVRTSADANTLTYTSSTDALSISINSSAYGSLTIVGLGDTPLTLDAAQLSSVLSVTGSTTNLTIANLTLTGGSANYGGGICGDSGTYTITGSEITGNTAKNYGGGIYGDSGTYTITDSTITGNTAKYYGGGIYGYYGTYTITNTRISEDRAEYVGTGGSVNGGGIYNSGTLQLINSEVVSNTAHSSYTGTYTNVTSQASGGGIYNTGTLTVTNSTIAGNTASWSNSKTSSYTGAWGGGIYNTGSKAKLYNTIVAENTAENGADVYASTALTGSNNLSTYEVWSLDTNYLYDPNLSLFKDKERGDFSLVPNMQAFDRGSNEHAANAGIDETWSDLAGNERFQNAAIDIGA